MNYFLGIDIGGTKSHALIADEQGNAVGIGAAGTGNQEVIGYEGLRAVLHDITSAALQSAGLQAQQIRALGLGIAGFDWPQDYAPHHEVVASLNITPFAFVNDAVIGLIAGSSTGWGVSVVAGTGNNCRGRDSQGREGRVAGTGVWSGEHGGGLDLAQRGLEAVSKAWCKRGPQTLLTEKFLHYLNAQNVVDLLEGLARDRYRINAHAAHVVFEAAAEGDTCAIEAICWMGCELAGMAIGVIHQLALENQTFEVVLTGSLYKGSPLIADTMRECIQKVAPGARLVPLNAPPVVGAVLLAMEQVNTPYASLRERLIASAKQALERTSHPSKTP